MEDHVANDPMDTIETVIALTSREQRHVLELCFSRIGLTMTHAAILEYLAYASRQGKPSLNQTELSEHLGLRKPSTGAAIDVLVARGLVERAPSPVDRRAWLVILTPAGRRLLPTLLGMKAALFAQITAGLSAEENTQLAVILAKVRENLAPIRRELESEGDGEVVDELQRPTGAQVQE